MVLPCNAPRRFARDLANRAPDGNVVVGSLVRLDAGFRTNPASSSPPRRSGRRPFPASRGEALQGSSSRSRVAAPYSVKFSQLFFLASAAGQPNQHFAPGKSAAGYRVAIADFPPGHPSHFLGCGGAHEAQARRVQSAASRALAWDAAVTPDGELATG